MSQTAYCIGVDYGTDSVRAIIVNAHTGEEIVSSVFHYPRWRDGLYCEAALSQFRQHPRDHIEGLEHVVRACLASAGDAVRSSVRAISIDTTGSTPVAVDETGTPLSMYPAFERDPDAMFVLWKDHTSLHETEEINAHAAGFEVNYLKYVGGVYSSEWYWSKLLHVLRSNAAVRAACYGWVEHCDWMVWLLTGGKHISDMKRSVCTAGHKALWAEEWGGFPPDDFFSTLDPLLTGYAAKLSSRTYASDTAAGPLCAEWAERLGLSPDVVIGIGAMDAHMGAVGGQIEPYYLSKVMGTSTCDMLVAPVADMEGKYVKGICGLVNGSVIPGMIGMEAGQSAFGDVYAWFRDLLAWPLREYVGGDVDAIIARIIPELSVRAAALPLREDSEISVDWLNGRRTPDANASLKGGIIGLGLGSDPASVLRALVEGTCFGAKAIVECFNQQGVPVKGLIGIGGVARKAPFVMQMMADIMGMPIKVNRSEQTCALGAAMFAATAAGIYPRVEEAMQVMGQGFDITYYPNTGRKSLYERRYQRYRSLGNQIEQQTITLKK